MNYSLSIISTLYIGVFFGFLAEDNGIPTDKIFFSKAIYLVSDNNYRTNREIDPKLIPGKLFRDPGNFNVKIMWSYIDNMVSVEITPHSGNL